MLLSELSELSALAVLSRLLGLLKALVRASLKGSVKVVEMSDQEGLVRQRHRRMDM